MNVKIALDKPSYETQIKIHFSVNIQLPSERKSTLDYDFKWYGKKSPLIVTRTVKQGWGKLLVKFAENKLKRG